MSIYDYFFFSTCQLKEQLSECMYLRQGLKADYLHATNVIDGLHTAVPEAVCVIDDLN